MEDDIPGRTPGYWNLDDFKNHLTSKVSKEWRGTKDCNRLDWDSLFAIPRKARFRHSAAEIDLPQEIRSAIHCLGSHPSEWGPITRQEELRGLRAGENILLYRQTGKGWETLRELTHAPRAETRVIALRRRQPTHRDRSAFTEALKRAHHDTTRQFFFHPTGSYLNTEPTVHIRRPADGDVIAWDNDRYTRRRLEDYTFQPGDTLESVTTRLLGYADPAAVYDRTMRNLNDPQAGDRARILVGRDLLVQGSASYTKGISLTWFGPAHDNRGVEVRENGKFDYGDWETRIPAGPGEYELIARVGQLQHKVKFKVIESDTSLWARAIGMAKALANQVTKSQGAMSAEWFAGQGVFEYRDRTTGEALTTSEVAERFTTEGQEILPPQGAGEEAGAEIIKALPQTPAIVGAITALGSEGKSILRHPQHFLEDLKKALTHSRSEAEAMGKAGMEQAHRRLDIEAAPAMWTATMGPTVWASTANWTTG